MTWGKVSDDLHSHPKWTGASPNAKALWCTALSYSNAYLTDGELVLADLEQLAVKTFGFKPSALRLAKAAAAELVERRLWVMLDPESQRWAFKDWADNNPLKKTIKGRKARDRRREELHGTDAGKELKRRVRQRDGSVCSWCSITVRWGAGGAPDAAQYDHVDSDGPNELWNVVVSCRSCNGTKGNRDYEEVGMDLRPGHPLEEHWARVRRRRCQEVDSDTGSSSARPAEKREKSAHARTLESADRGRGAGRAGSGRGGTDLVGSDRGGTAAPEAPDPDYGPFDDPEENAHG